eukprot:6206942-Pleurochrysis_carterae.AAC.1
MLLAAETNYSLTDSSHSRPAATTWGQAACPNISELKSTSGDGDSREDGDDDTVENDMADTNQTFKRSMYWNKEVEERVGLAGADPYGLLELDEKRWRASAEELRKAYRRLVLTHHPDKKAAAGAVAANGKKDSPRKENEAKNKVKDEKSAKKDDIDTDDTDIDSEDEEDSEFKLLTRAWELLGNAETRRAYDSVDYFNDNMPQSFRPKPERGPDHFYRVFGPVFRRQAKFSVETP